jgi:hypothetical protein
MIVDPVTADGQTGPDLPEGYEGAATQLPDGTYRLGPTADLADLRAEVRGIKKAASEAAATVTGGAKTVGNAVANAQADRS